LDEHRRTGGGETFGAALAAILDSAMDAVITIDSARRIVFSNSAAAEMFGCRREDMVGQPIERLIPERSRPAHAGHVERFARSGITRRSPHELGEVTGLRTNGEEFPAEASISRTESGGEQLLTVILRDVTARKKAEHALRASEERFSKAFRGSPIPMIITRVRDEVVVDANDSMLKLLGYAREEVCGASVLELRILDDEQREKLAEALFDRGSVREQELTIRVRSGADRRVLASADRTELAGEMCVIATFQDVTEQRALEAQLRHSQKMDAVGRLAGGVAHDFNNLLTVITSCGEMVLDSLTPEDPRRSEMLEIREAARQAAVLTRQLLAFSRKQLLAPKVLDLNALVREMERLLRRVISEDITLVTELDPALEHVRADPAQLQQVVLNMVVNARDAMPRGGRLTLRTANVRSMAAAAGERVVMAPGEYVMLAVSDTGVGMDEKTRSRVFEPFFTTKENGKGTGLGLATVYGIVKQSGGYVWVESLLGQGSTFEIYLPRSGEPVGAAPARAMALAAPRGRETLLLVEDADAVRAVTRVILERAGYSIIEASTGAEALEQARRRTETIHLLVADVIMPGMSGPALAGELRAIHPETRVLYLSGYAGDEMGYGSGPPGTCLPKPFTPDALARKVRDILDD
jgi:two-component system cell cycle sensor histidine kinase/response regulator CckA